MISNFKIFGIEHVISLLIPFAIGLTYMPQKKHPEKKKTISVMLTITIVFIKNVKYAFEIVPL